MILGLAVTVHGQSGAGSKRAGPMRPGLASVPLPPRAPSAGPRFERLSAERTGIDFVHRFTDAPEHVNVLANASSGGGVATGDADGDGKPEVFLTRSVGGNRIYRNLGGLRFVDATEALGLEDDAWGTGATFADVDGDGDLDLHVCGYDTDNRLFINDGPAGFSNRAQAAGLAFAGASIAMAFADYDLDGDLDGYLLTNRINPMQEAQGRVPTENGVPVLPPEMKQQYDVLARPDGGVSLVAAGQYDHLYRNDGSGRFEDVSAAAGISGNEFGLSVTWWDSDVDGWPDLYVANDFFGPDKLYRNQGDGRFVDVARDVLPSTPWFSMGSDAGDVDNDGFLDYFASDMAGLTHQKRHTAMGETDEVRWFLSTPVPRQLMRNALYLNTGAGPFREVARMAGVEASGWTWSTLFGDLDEDGWLDLYVSNGMTRDFFDSDLRRRAFAVGDPNDAVKSFWTGQAPLAEPNLAFRNRGDLSFERVENVWGLDHLGVTFGAALDDLDGDGDLDLVTNNWNEAPGLYENRSHDGHRVTVTLRGRTSNRQGLGALVRVITASGVRTRLVNPVRGFMASSSAAAVFGLGRDERVQRLVVEWPSGHVQVLDDLPVDQAFTVTEPKGKGPGPHGPGLPPPIFAGSNGALSVEQPYDDFARQPLLPWQLSRLGPGLASADVDGDGHTDFALGGPAGQATQLFRNEQGRRFAAWDQPALARDSDPEDMGLLFLDADGDGDQDLYLVSGGVECSPGALVLRDRLRLNDGTGLLSPAPEGALPDLRDSGGAVAAADVDRDGDLDLVVAGRSIPGRWPAPASSRLLLNDGGSFSDATAERAPALLDAGLVTGLSFGDLFDDGVPALLLAREWGAPLLLRNDAGVLVDASVSAGLADARGLWNSVSLRDLDGDGDLDGVLGNMGLNSPYQASLERPLRIFYGDCDGSGEAHVVESGWDGDRPVPLACRSCATRAMPVLGELFPSFLDYSLADLHDLYPPELLDETLALSVTTLQSCVLRNLGGGRLVLEPLPRLAQCAPVFGSVLEDVDGDGVVDLVLAQNLFSTQPEIGPLAGGVGLLLRGRGDGAFDALPAWQSGYVVSSDAKSLSATDFDGDGRVDLLTGVNSGPLAAHYNRGVGEQRFLSVDLAGPDGNPTAVGARVTLRSADGHSSMAEVTAGSGYLSQSSATLRFGLGASRGALQLSVRWPDGHETSHPVDAAAGRVRLSP